MVDTPIFSIFHRAPPPPAPPPVAPAAIDPPPAPPPVAAAPTTPTPEPVAAPEPVAVAPTPEPIVEAPPQAEAEPVAVAEAEPPAAVLEPVTPTPEPIVEPPPQAEAEAVPVAEVEPPAAAPVDPPPPPVELAAPPVETPPPAEPPATHAEPVPTPAEPQEEPAEQLETVAAMPAAEPVDAEPHLPVAPETPPAPNVAATSPEPAASEDVEYHIAPPEHGNAELQTEDFEAEAEAEPTWYSPTKIELHPDAALAAHEEEVATSYPAADETLPDIPVDEPPVMEDAVEAWDEPPAHHEAVAESESLPWQGPTSFTGIPVSADQLGLANPIIITLLARLEDSSTIELDASQSGIYRPQRFRVAPWSGFPYDQAENGRTGLAAGTRILTSRGEMEVERLLPGDTALALRTPKLMPIAWIGRSNATVAPILIEAGALGPDLPRRALCLAPDQAVFVEPIPVPVAQLVNGTTIRMLDTADVDLFHVDVGASEILFAEGLPLSSSDRNRVQSAR